MTADKPFTPHGHPSRSSAVSRYIDLYREHCGALPTLNNQECEAIWQFVQWALSESGKDNRGDQADPATGGSSPGDPRPSSSDKVETPRTDALERQHKSGFGNTFYGEMAQHARQLERELACAKSAGLRGEQASYRIGYVDGATGKPPQVELTGPEKALCAPSHEQRSAVAAIQEHNKGCLEACGKTSSHQYVRDSRRCDERRDCPDCPKDWLIEWPSEKSQKSI
jgi:hypothetical protein